MNRNLYYLTMVEGDGQARVVINCDDLGMSPGINRAIKYLYQQGRINSTSIMVNMPWSSEALAFAIDLPDLRTGVHLNLSTGLPVRMAQDVPTLVRSDGSFHEISAFVSRFVAGRIKLSEVEAELEGQIEVAMAKGLQPTHLDSHMHFHAIPTLANLVIDLADKFEIPLVRNPDLSAFVVPPSGKERQVQDAIYNACGRLLGATQSIFSRHTSGPMIPAIHSEQLIYLRWCLGEGTDPASRFQACLDKLNGQTLEIVAHPAEYDDYLPEMSGYVDGRQQELSFLDSERFLELMQKNQLALV